MSALIRFVPTMRPILSPGVKHMVSVSLSMLSFLLVFHVLFSSPHILSSIAQQKTTLRDLSLHMFVKCPTQIRDYLKISGQEYTLNFTLKQVIVIFGLQSALIINRI